jgi:hypothetical protein
VTGRALVETQRRIGGLTELGRTVYGGWSGSSNDFKIPASLDEPRLPPQVALEVSLGSVWAALLLPRCQAPL